MAAAGRQYEYIVLKQAFDVTGHDREPRRVQHRYEPTLDQILTPLTADLDQALAADLIGLYLYGSAVSGGFDAGVSDVDLIAVTARDAMDLDLRSLRRIHRRVLDRDGSWTDRLEIVYVSRSTLERGAASKDNVAVISPGERLHVTGPASDWLQNWYLARETGVALCGPPATEAFPAVAHADFLAAVRRYLWYLGRQVTAELKPGAIAYFVLSACRAARTIEMGVHGSKQDGAAWMRERMPGSAWLIDAALACRLSRGTAGFADRRTRDGARGLVKLLSSSHADSDFSAEPTL